jgi:hypothetical protein
MVSPYVVSEATLRTEDLLPAFLSALDDVLEASTFLPGADAPERVRRVGEVQSLLGEIERRMDGEGYYGSDVAECDLEAVTELLEEYAPEGLYFGAHEGDGACFGFWAVEDDSDDHEHVWGPVEEARFTGNPHRSCQVPGCREITLDLSDDDSDE